MEVIRHKQSETTPQEFCPSCVRRVTSLKTLGLCFHPIPMTANTGPREVQQRQDLGQWQVSLGLQHPAVLLCYCQFQKKESIICFTGNSRSQTMPPPHIHPLCPSPQSIPRIEFPHLLPGGTPFTLVIQFLRAGVSELRVRRRKWKLLNQSRF